MNEENFKNWLNKNKNRWHDAEYEECPYCYHNAEWLDIKRLGEWALLEIKKACPATVRSVIRNIDDADSYFHSPYIIYLQIAIGCFGKEKTKQKLKEAST